MSNNTENKVPMLSLSHVCKNFGGVKAVCDVTCDIAHGERRLFIGTNGAGKTTLFNLITGDLPVSSGKVCINGKDVTKSSIQSRVRMGMQRTYQSSALFANLTVRQNLYLAIMGAQPVLRQVNLLKNYKKSVGYCDRLEETARKVSLGEKLDELVCNLSHGECRQLEIGLALINSPSLLLFDEPSSGLSENERQIILALLQGLDRDITIVLIEHNMELAFAVADYVTVMFNGSVVAEGTPAEVQANELVQKIYLGGVGGDERSSS
ncbi:MAG: ABC transporter ATP-binding protein [Oscillospiraceae bacterium]